MSAFIAHGEEGAQDIPEDLLVGWGKGVRIHLLVVGSYKAL